MKASALQAALIRRKPGRSLTLVVTLLQSITFLSLVTASGNSAAVVNAVLAPGLIGLWVASIDLAGEIIAEDRWNRRFELIVITRVPLSVVVFGRVIIVIGFGALAFAEAWLVAAIGFGQVVTIREPLIFVVGVAATCLAMAGTATLLTALFVLSRAMEMLQNSLSYPLYILGGVVVPITFLPDWLRPASRLLFLSWSGDLLRNAMRGASADWVAQLAAILLLGATAGAIGLWLTRVVVDRTRREGTVGHA
ncbi:ABC transporter permease [Actinomadura monticuli]|uniref:ABC transporter permease n=1 Tax=Actinomadura monticuli TaxID=3097367 RepID=A0ABV4Q4X5_9ACTN